MSALTWIGVALIGGAAAVARVTVDGCVGWFLIKAPDGSPGLAPAVGTFAVNVTGSFVLGLADGLALSGDASILVATAGIGSYTTFSTWMLQTRVLRGDGARLAAAVNAVASVVAGFGAVALGRLIGAG